MRGAANAMVAVRAQRERVVGLCVRAHFLPFERAGRRHCNEVSGAAAAAATAADADSGRGAQAAQRGRGVRLALGRKRAEIPDGAFVALRRAS